MSHIPYLFKDHNVCNRRTSSVQEFVKNLERTGNLNEFLNPYWDDDEKFRDRFSGKEPGTGSHKDNPSLFSLFDHGPINVPLKGKSTFSQNPNEYVLSGHRGVPEVQKGLGMVKTLDDFTKNFSLFSGDILKCLNWDNVVVAGGAITSSLLPRPDHVDYDSMAPRADIDLFLYNLGPDQAKSKLCEIEAEVEEALRQTQGYAETVVLRTANAVTILLGNGRRAVQIVCRLYETVEQILIGFDLDCSAVAYDGQKVFASPRAIAAFATRINKVHMDRRSPSYEHRLFKYSKRGFGVFVQGLDRMCINPSLYLAPKKRQKGLAKLLWLEAFNGSETNYGKYRNAVFKNRNSSLAYCDLAQKDIPVAIVSKDRIEDSRWALRFNAEHSGYETFIIPNLLDMPPLLVQNLILEWDHELNESNHTLTHRHPVFVGTMQHVIQDCCKKCPTSEDPGPYVAGELNFLSENAGRQMVGSFNPITEGVWSETAYIGLLASLCNKIVHNNVLGVQGIVETDAAICNQYDQVGRSPLHLACMCSSPEITRYLVDRGASPARRMLDGQTAFHIAAARGNVEILHALQGSEQRSSPKAAESDEVNLHALEPSKAYDVESQPGGVSAPGKGLARGVGFSPLHLAILHGHVEIVRELVTLFGADINAPLRLPELDCRSGPTVEYYEVENCELAYALPQEVRISMLGELASKSTKPWFPLRQPNQSISIKGTRSSSNNGSVVRRLRDHFEGCQGPRNSITPPEEAQHGVVSLPSSDEPQSIHSACSTPAVSESKIRFACDSKDLYSPNTAMAGLPSFIDDFHGGNLKEVEQKICKTGLPFLLMSDIVGLLNMKSSGYQGLLVNGQREIRANTDILDNWRPLDTAVFQNDLEMVRWILSDAPSLCFQDYVASNLAKVLNGPSIHWANLEQVVNFRMRHGVSTVLKRAVSSQLDWSKAGDLVTCVINFNNSRSTREDSYETTPLTTAFSMHNVGAAEQLLRFESTEAEIKMNKCDRSGNNLLHLMLQSANPRNYKDCKKIEQLVRCLAENTAREMLQQVNGSIETPFASWLEKLPNAEPDGLRRNQADLNDLDIRMAGMMISLAHEYGIPLRNLLGGAGNRSVHGLVRKRRMGILELMKKEDSSLFDDEDLTGRTPLELLWDSWSLGVASAAFHHKAGLQAAEVQAELEVTWKVYQICQDLEPDKKEQPQTRPRQLIDHKIANEWAQKLIHSCKNG